MSMMNILSVPWLSRLMQVEDNHRNIKIMQKSSEENREEENKKRSMKGKEKAVNYSCLWCNDTKDKHISCLLFTVAW